MRSRKNHSETYFVAAGSDKLKQCGKKQTCSICTNPTGGPAISEFDLRQLEELHDEPDRRVAARHASTIAGESHE